MLLKTFHKMEYLYEKDQRFRGSSKETQIKKAYDNGEIYYLKPVFHQGYRIPVTLVVRDFDEHPVTMFDWMYILSHTLFQTGALGTMMFDVPELFDNQINPKMGYLIVIDKRISKYTNDSFDQLLAHEYYHAMCDDADSIVNTMIKDHFGQKIDSKKIKNGIINRPEEELAADEFSLNITGKKPNVRKAIDYVLNECSEMQRLPFFLKWFIKVAFFGNLIKFKRFY